MKIPKISVVMSCYNREHFVVDAIKSILNQTYTDFEFIIVDDCSIDSTPEIIQKYADKDDRIILIKNNKNMDYNYNLRKGFELAKGEYLARMDDDDISLPKRFEKQVKFLDENPDITVLGTFIETFGEIAESWVTETDPDKLAIIMDFQNPMCHPSVMIRREFLTKHKLNYSPEAVYAEEYDLWKNIIFKGGKLANLPEVLLKYRIHCNRISQASKSQKIQMNTVKRVKSELLLRYFKKAEVDKILKEMLYPIQANNSKFLSRIFERIGAQEPKLNKAVKLLQEEFCGVPCTMDIFFASDDRFAQHLCVAMTSILVNSFSFENFNFYILDGEISEENKKLIKHLSKIRDFNIEFIKVDDSLFDICPITPECNHISKQTYYRYLIPKLKPNIEKCFYFDCDIVVEDSLNKFWHMDLKDNYAAVVEELYKEAVNDRTRLNINSYFNAGVMFINNKLWLQENMSDKLFEQTALMLGQNKIKWVDQDVLNYAFHDKVVFVSPMYNLQQNAYYDGQHSMYSEQEMREAKHHPIIIHYNGHLKPWNKDCKHLLWRRYFKYLNKTPFRRVYYKHKIKVALKAFPSMVVNGYRRVIKFLGVKPKALVFGTGVIAKDILPLINEEYKLLAFIDNNQGKWGGEFERFPICKPDEISVIDYDVIIVATVAGLHDVVAQLLDMGVKHRNIIDSQFMPLKMLD